MSENCALSGILQTGHLLDSLHGVGQGTTHSHTGHQAGVVVGKEAAGHITGDVQTLHGLVVGVQSLTLFVDGDALLGGQQRGTQPAAVEGSGADGAQTACRLAEVLIVLFVIQFVVAGNGGYKVVLVGTGKAHLVGKLFNGVRLHDQALTLVLLQLTFHHAGDVTGQCRAANGVEAIYVAAEVCIVDHGINVTRLLEGSVRSVVVLLTLIHKAFAMAVDLQEGLAAGVVLTHSAGEGLAAKGVLAVHIAGTEHDVSLRSAQGLYSFFDKERYNVYIVDVKGQDWHVNYEDGDIAKIDRNDFSFVNKEGKAVVFDYAYITIHGTPGENGIMQGYFDLIHLPYSTSGVLVEAMTFNKYVLNNYLRGFGVNVADSILLRLGESYDAAAIEKRLGMPVFVKPAADGSSFGVSKVKNADQLAPALRVAFMESTEVMIEGFMKGTEISIGCYKTKDKAVVFPATEVVTKNEFFDYDAKYNGQVQEITPARLSPETAKKVADETSHIYDILHCNGIIRIDYIISKDTEGKDKVNMLEINTTPGMTPTSFIPQQVKTAGLSMKDVLTDIIENQF